MARKFYLTLDCETSYRFYPIDREDGKNVKPIWDIAWVVTDSKGVVYETAEYSPIEFRQFWAQMVEKKDETCAKINRAVKRNVIAWQDIINALDDTIARYKIDKIWAYNAAFDSARIADMNRVAEIETAYEFGDIWNLAVTTQTLNVRYFQFCTEHGYISDKGNLKTSAEIMSRYLNLDPTFIEAHTALADCRIEAEIFRICRDTKTKTKDDSINGFCWKTPQEKFKAWREKQTA